MIEIFKQDGLTIWHYEFKYLNNFKTWDGKFTGTYKAFKELTEQIDPKKGFHYNVKKRHATKEEYECLKSFWKYARQVKEKR